MSLAAHLPVCCCICQHSSSAFWACPHFTYPNIIAFQVPTSWDGILLNILSILHAHIWHTGLHPTKTSPSEPLWWMICSSKHLPSWSPHKLPYGFSICQFDKSESRAFCLHFLEKLKLNRHLMLPSLDISLQAFYSMKSCAILESLVPTVFQPMVPISQPSLCDPGEKMK
jgi:hypothetical protein